MSIFDHQSYRNFLKTVLADKAKRNPAYSLRAMAKSLEMAPSYFSTILNGGKNLSFEKAAAVAQKLDLKAKESDYFCLLVQAEASKKPEIKEALLEKIRSLNPRHVANDLSVDHFRIIADWYHFAILASIDLKDFKPTTRQFAVALDLPQSVVTIALDRLERLETIEKTKSGNYQKVLGNPRVVSSAPNTALRIYHRQTLQKAAESLETQSPQEKIIGSETFAFDEAQLDEMRELSEEFFARALEIAKKSKNKNQVFHLGVQLFSLTPSLKKTKRKSK